MKQQRNPYTFTQRVLYFVCEIDCCSDKEASPNMMDYRAPSLRCEERDNAQVVLFSTN